MLFLMGTGPSKRSSSLEKKAATAARNGKKIDSVAKDERFFDSQGYLHSDGEDEDYYSVNEEPTSSDDGTPKHQTGTTGNEAPQVNKVLPKNEVSDGKSESSPRKNLGQFFDDETSSEVSSKNEVKTKKKRICCLPPVRAVHR